MMRWIAMLLLLASITTPTEARPQDAPKKTRQHADRMVEGWTLEVDTQLLEGRHAKLGSRALKALSHALHNIASVLPRKKVEEMQKVRIRMDLDHPLGGLQYHPNRRWLVEHGHAPDLTRRVHIPNVRRYLDLHRSNIQPWVILHELAHAWHDQVIGFDDARVRKGWNAARAHGRYKQVLHAGGAQRRHYALKDHKEFFAEMTEAWFGTNDFFPFVRAELLESDPDTAAVMGAVWGPDRRR